MAVRLRKIARELERTPEDLMRLLQELGYDRFRSEDDMLPESVADQVRKVARTRPPRAIGSVRATPAGREVSAASPPRAVEVAGIDGETEDLMARLVPGVTRSGVTRSGVTRTGGGAPRAARSRPPETVRAPSSSPAPAPGPAATPAPVSRSELAAALARAEAAEAAANEARAALAVAITERDGLRAAAEEPRQTDEPSLLQLLEERGLRGSDEAERAISALAASRLFGRILAHLRSDDPESVRRLLSERLILAGGPLPNETPGYPIVTVSSERADLPAYDALVRLLARIGEQTLLHGWRRVLLIGVAPRWHALIRDGFDRRIELTFRAIPGEEAVRPDLVVTWNSAAPDPDPRRATPGGNTPPRIALRASGFGEFVERWLSALSEYS